MSTRSIAVKVLREVVQEKHSLTAMLDSHLANVDSAQERAFIQALCYGVIRHFYELEQLLNTLLSKPLKAKDLDVKLLGMLGLYQLKHMRVKEHAAVSETVAAAKRQPWAKALLNAVFRRYGREKAQFDALPNTQHNHPDWLLARLQADWPEQLPALLAANNAPPPMALRVNTGRCIRTAYLDLLSTANLPAEAGRHSSSAVVLAHPVPVTELPNFAEGWVSVQDTAAQLAADLLAVQAGHRVLDLCAAPGGKTCAILEQQPQLQSLWAVDIDASRLGRVRDNLQRLGLSAELRVGDALEPEAWWDGTLFERILVDAPCSALGVVRRHPDIKLLRLPEDIASLASLQQGILAAAWRMLAPGGVLLYATCSVMKAENEQQVSAFLQAHSDASEWPIPGPWGLETAVGRQVLTGMDGMDGFYYARLRKV
jgi:16S rRNA (cytosine967-C5)-methyltransferase